MARSVPSLGAKPEMCNDFLGELHMAESDETSPGYSLSVNDRTVTVIDHGSVVTLVVTGIPKGHHPGRLYRRVTHKGEPGRTLDMTREGAVALFRLLEQTEGVKELLKRRQESAEILSERRRRLALEDPCATDWEF